MRKALVVLGIAMIVAGIGVGAYYLYCTQFSGAQIGKFPASGRSGKWTLSDGSSQVFPGGRATKPISVDLDPAMNPVGINWSGSPSGSVDKRASNSYGLWLFLAGRPVAHESFSVSLDEKDHGGLWTWSRSWKSIARFTVPQPGRYDVVLEDEAPVPAFRVSDVQIELRRNVTVPIKSVLLSGLASFILGFLVMFGALHQGPGPRTVVVGFAAAGLVAAGWLFALRYFTPEGPAAFRAAPPAGSQAAAAAGQPIVARFPQLPPSAPVDTGEIFILEAEPGVARIGGTVTLLGKNFGHRQNHGVFIGGHGMKVPLEVVEWGPESIRARIPNDPRLKPGAYYYRVERVETHESSNLFMFAVRG